MEEESQQHDPAATADRTAGPQEPAKTPSEVDRDTHRGFVREMNKAFASVYGYGGAAVIALVAAGVALAAHFGVLGSPLVWIATVTLFLVSLFVLRIFVRRRAQSMVERIRQYCAVNDVSTDEFRQRFSGEGLYPYFESIFEVVERRQKLQNQLRDSK